MAESQAALRAQEGRFRLARAPVREALTNAHARGTRDAADGDRIHGEIVHEERGKRQGLATQRFSFDLARDLWGRVFGKIFQKLELVGR